MSTPITTADRLRWQWQASAVLHQLIDHANAKRLPPITWQIGVAGTVMGRCIDTVMNARREAFERWADFLGIAGWSEWEADGVVRRYGVTNGFNNCPVSISAYLELPARGAR